MRTSAAADALKLAIVIPALNEERNIQQALSSVRGKARQVIVVDGGSTDQTVSLAKATGAQVIQAPRGRGPQQNAGWRAAKKADWCLFLHADTQLPCDFDELLAQQLQQPDRQPCWGCFRSIRLTQVPAWQSWLVEACVALRTHCCRLPYGDQALFVRRETLETLKGFDDLRMLEDVELVRRLNRLSPPLVLPAPTTTSGRRYARLGFLRTVALNQLVMLGWTAGVPHQVLHQWYQQAGPH